MSLHFRKLAALLLAAALVGCSGSPWVGGSARLSSPTASNSNPAAESTNTSLPGQLTAEPAALASPLPSPSPTAVIPAQYVVLLSLDGFRPQYLALSAMPNLKSLIDSGTSYPLAWVGALENNTPTAHTMMSTGSFPRRNGIPGYNWYDMQTGEFFNPTSEESVNAGEMAAIVEKSGVPTLAKMFKTRWPDGIVAAISAQKYYAAQALGMGPADFILYCPSLQNGCKPKAVNGRAPSAAFLKQAAQGGAIKGAGAENKYALRLAVQLVETYPPRALLINLPETDTVGHNKGGLSDPESIRVVLDATDAAIGDLMNAYRQAGIFNQTLWVITSDHGMTPKENIIVPAELYQSVGIQLSDQEHGSLPGIRLRDPNQAMPDAEKIAAANVPGILGVYARVKEGDSYHYQAAPSTQASLPDALNQSFLYLLSTYVDRYSPDVVVTSSGNTAFDKSHVSPGGSHNMVNWADQNIFMAFAGPGTAVGVVSNAPARLVDILPTVAGLMELPLEGADGSLLADALQKPGPQEIQTQEAVNTSLAPLRDALMETGKK